MYNSKNFQWLNKKISKIDIERTMNELGKPFLKKSDQNTKKKQKIKAETPHLNKKPLARNGHFVQTKTIGLEWSMNGLGKTI